MPKQHFVKYPTFDYSILGEVCEQAPVSFHFLSFSFLFSLAKHALRMCSQRISG